MYIVVCYVFFFFFFFQAEDGIRDADVTGVQTCALPISIDNTVFNKILHLYKAENKEDLYYMIGSNEVALPGNKDAFQKMKPAEPEKQDNLFVRYMKQAVNAIKKGPEVKNSQEVKATGKDPSPAPLAVVPTIPKVDRKAVYRLTESNFRKNFIVPLCCNPLPGDDVFGYITEKEEVEVHKRACQTGLKLKSNFGDRVIEVAWGDYRQYSFLASIVFTGIDRIGILSSILSKLTDGMMVNIQSVNVSTKDGIFEGVFNLHVHSAEEVNQLCAKIAKVDGVSTVHRSPV